ncbi:peptidyl-prolyl cis-trans isomerase [Shewanella colwelliana]|uniref:FKBP-type peptidyl-prolyl cis-trans isomerase n=1 Tax=Shewanella colwelliana TaxID=23 RepID=UPI001BBDFD44|nr:FKBP-type peptidyl-prolyl cis-trans isomerase [Shewanella colwelliana]GIU19881.1 peptidyl-prolyl cis-trans isomerase [Shewanella colwelliana]
MKMFAKTALSTTTFAVLCGLSFVVSASETRQQVDDASYALGASVGHYISGKIYSQVELGAEVNVDIVVEGVIDALKGKGKMSDEEILTHLNARVELLNAAKDARIEAISVKNLAEGAAYLANNKTNSAVTVTSTGLQYEVLELGEGVKPLESNVVTVHYKGQLVDGTVFDDSYERNEPNRFALMSVIDGWKEGIALMPEGSTFRLTIPAELAYGKEQVGIIPPSSTLIFDVELLKVEEPGANSHGMGLSGMGMGGMVGMGH